MCSVFCFLFFGWGSKQAKKKKALTTHVTGDPEFFVQLRLNRFGHATRQLLGALHYFAAAAAAAI
jgi:hypothetical protein